LCSVERAARSTRRGNYRNEGWRRGALVPTFFMAFSCNAATKGGIQCLRNSSSGRSVTSLRRSFRFASRRSLGVRLDQQDASSTARASTFFT
jgi:hypothetical protein